MTVAARIEKAMMQPPPYQPASNPPTISAWPNLPRRESELCESLSAQLAGLMNNDPDSLCLLLTDAQLALPVTEWIDQHLGRLDANTITAPQIDSLIRFRDTALQASYMRAHIAREDHVVLCIRLGDDGPYRYFLMAASNLTPREVELAFIAADLAIQALTAASERAQVVALQTHVLSAVAGLAEPRTRSLAGHVLRVGLLAEFMARAYGFSDERAEAYRLAAPLHDLGKLCVPLELLCKSERLTDSEWLQMREHAEAGRMLLAHPRDSLHQLASDIAGNHHENWDGSGYPKGVRGTEIPLSARIVAIVDVYDALRSERCYKPAWSESEVRGHIVRERGRKFDPVLVDLLLAHWQEAEQIRDATRWPTPEQMPR
ncbi:hypothetical protein C7S18_13605 [Ahniella affigens]|uniref:HD-GYP domain-containing protein n=1 Tax=Ahniella affigens TaxID=2021234 RepID=A0A2P1PTJ4_9GAMM|nr:HD domain-containing phosphohydrolase [Ahniella affigens]AVP98164.1 hypothetical protein C7S18_13605 [Ahniella affigens]